MQGGEKTIFQLVNLIIKNETSGFRRDGCVHANVVRYIHSKNVVLWRKPENKAIWGPFFT